MDADARLERTIRRAVALFFFGMFLFSFVAVPLGAAVGADSYFFVALFTSGVCILSAGFILFFAGR